MIAVTRSRARITSAPFGRPQDVGRRTVEHRLDLLATIASEATAYGRQLECEVGARAREGEERADVALNDSKRQRAELVVLAGNGVAVALQTRALPLDCAAVLTCPEGCALAVAACKIAAEDENGFGHRALPGIRMASAEAQASTWSEPLSARSSPDSSRHGARGR